MSHFENDIRDIAKKYETVAPADFSTIPGYDMPAYRQERMNVLEALEEELGGIPKEYHQMTLKALRSIFSQIVG